MTIASEITRINNNIANAYTACNNKGATMPATQNSVNLATCISSISGGGGGLPTTLYCFRSSTLTPRAIWLMSIENGVVQKGIYPSSSSRIGATTNDFYYVSSNQILFSWDGVQGEVTNYTRYSSYDVTL